MKIHTWISRSTGITTKKVSFRIEHHVDLDNMASGLVRAWLDVRDWGSFPDALSARTINDMVRGAYSSYGTNAVWAWSDEYGYSEAEAMRERARQVILAACPEFEDER